MFDDNNITPAAKPEAAANAGTDLQHAQGTEQAFMQEIQQTPKEAVATATAQPATADPAQAAAPAKPGGTGIFNSDFLKKITGTTTPEQEAPKQQEYKPFADTEQPEAEKGNGPTAENPRDEAMSLRKCRTFINMMDMAMSRGLAMYDTSGDFQKYKITEAEKSELAEGLNEWGPEVIEKLPAYAMFMTSAITIYGPMVFRANDLRKVNIRNARIAVQIKPNGNSMQHAAAKAVPFNVNMGAAPTAKGERTRYEIHTDGTYCYSRKFPDRKAAYLKLGDPECEKVNLGDTEAIKHIILKNDGWRKAASRLGVPDEWMIQRGLNNNNPEIAD